MDFNRQFTFDEGIQLVQQNISNNVRVSYFFFLISYDYSVPYLGNVKYISVGPLESFPFCLSILFKFVWCEEFLTSLLSSCLVVILLWLYYDTIGICFSVIWKICFLSFRVRLHCNSLQTELIALTITNYL